MRTQQKQRVETFVDPWVVKQYFWYTGAKKSPESNTETFLFCFHFQTDLYQIICFDV